jgi:hypothetical protein
VTWGELGDTIFAGAIGGAMILFAHWVLGLSIVTSAAWGGFVAGRLDARFEKERKK